MKQILFYVETFKSLVFEIVKTVLNAPKPFIRTAEQERQLAEWKKITDTEEWKRTHIFIENGDGTERPYNPDTDSHWCPKPFLASCRC